MINFAEHSLATFMLVLESFLIIYRFSSGCFYKIGSIMDSAFSATSFSSSLQKDVNNGRMYLSYSEPPRNWEKLVISSRTANIMET